MKGVDDQTEQDLLQVVGTGPQRRRCGIAGLVADGDAFQCHLLAGPQQNVFQDFTKLAGGRVHFLGRSEAVEGAQEHSARMPPVCGVMDDGGKVISS